ncbi:hypothetical protein B0H11DRAFT_2243519 [Mycena galericulata]|nr:hypothetical protein B0H11DRAFT_2243519 [Mycena galericulata]
MDTETVYPHDPLTANGPWSFPPPPPPPDMSMTLPGSFDPSTGIFYRKPENPRLRTAQACEKCRSRKAKCSGEHPSCSRCLARGLPCEYGNNARVRGPNRRGRAALSVSQSSHSTASYEDAQAKRRRRRNTTLEPLVSSVPLHLALPAHQRSANGRNRLSLPSSLGGLISVGLPGDSPYDAYEGTDVAPDSSRSYVGAGYDYTAYPHAHALDGGGGGLGLDRFEPQRRYLEDPHQNQNPKSMQLESGYAIDPVLTRLHFDPAVIHSPTPHHPPSHLLDPPFHPVAHEGRGIDIDPALDGDARSSVTSGSASASSGDGSVG